MGVFTAGLWAIKGRFDVFDRAIDAIEEVGRMLPPIEIHVREDRHVPEDVHFYDPAEYERWRLDHAADLVRYACQITQEVLGGIE